MIDALQSCIENAVAAIKHEWGHEGEKTPMIFWQRTDNKKFVISSLEFVS